jgi:HNH endonuclease
VTVDVVVDVHTLAGDGAPQLASLRHDLERVGPVPRTTAERLACDCSVGRVVMRGDSEILDLGRQTGLVTTAQRRALVHRDRQCAFPGCDRPPRWCDAHHLVPWQHGGSTDPDNLVLLCRRHHVLCHEGGWRLAAAPTVRRSRPDRRPPAHGVRHHRTSTPQRQTAPT